MASGDKMLADMTKKLTISPPVLLPTRVKPGESSVSIVPVVANAWGIECTSHMPIYRYDIRILEEYPSRSSGEAGIKEVTKQCREDYISIERKNKCVIVFRTLLEKEKSFFGKKERLVYDRASILYSIEKLDIPQSTEKSFTLLPEEVADASIGSDCVKIRINIKPCEVDFELTTNDLSLGVNRNPDFVNRSLQQFLELLISQQSFFAEGEFVSYGTRQAYFYSPEAVGFSEADMPQLPDGMYIGIGTSKAVKIVEGPGGSSKMKAAVIMDVKKAAFHVDGQELLQKLPMILGTDVKTLSLTAGHISLLTKALTGLYVRCTYGKQHSFPINGLTKETAASLKIQVNNSMKTVQEYFKMKHSINLKFASLPLVVERKPNGLNYYPMELLIVCENQRVKHTQQSSALVQAMVRACATAPYLRFNQTKMMTNAMGIGGMENLWFKEFGIQTKTIIPLKARILPAPTIEYANHAINVLSPEKTTWITGKSHYILPARCDKWNIVALCEGRSRFSNNLFRTYIQAFIGQCRRRGILIGEPIDAQFIPNARLADVERAIISAKMKQCTFLHFITGDMLKFHEQIKLLEMREQIVTQDLTVRTAEAAPQKWQTLDNIVNKTNLKLGGINFNILLNTKGPGKDAIINPFRIIVGIDVAHPPGKQFKGEKATMPSVVGYSSNCKRVPIEYVGGYRFAKAEMEELQSPTICDLMVESFHNFEKHRGVLPKHVIVLRDGISDGQLKYVVNTEVKQLQDACRFVGGDRYRPHITLIVATKQHNIRIYKQPIPKGRPIEQNITPGTVVDQGIVNPVLTEFYLTSHSAIQGTTKTPKYTVVFDTSKMEADEMQSIIYGLAFNHQIVNAPISLPAPIFIAARMAYRGRCNLIAKYGEASQSGTEIPPLEMLNSELSYVDKSLAMCRFNA